jgi:hypothetical protein
MKEVAKTVKRQINEMSVSNDRLNRIRNKRKELEQQALDAETKEQ